ncbi:unnamed protein product [Ectocarpus sp. CCAP 1310/34]|nr:unnamed protein product [Ectocarpus sp. CCAP 1310/34]
MKAWEKDLTLPLGIDIFWVEGGGGDGAPGRELLERWEITCVVAYGANAKQEGVWGVAENVL